MLESRPELGAMARWVGLVTTGCSSAASATRLDFHHAGAYEKACGLNLKSRAAARPRGGAFITHRGSACAASYMFVLRWKARPRGLRLGRAPPELAAQRGKSWWR